MTEEVGQRLSTPIPRREESHHRYPPSATISPASRGKTSKFKYDYGNDDDDDDDDDRPTLFLSHTVTVELWTVRPLDRTSTGDGLADGAAVDGQDNQCSDQQHRISIVHLHCELSYVDHLSNTLTLQYR